MIVMGITDLDCFEYVDTLVYFRSSVHCFDMSVENFQSASNLHYTYK